MHPVSPCVVCGFLGQLEALGLVSFDLKELCHFIAIQVLSFFMYIVAKKDPEASNRDFFFGIILRSLDLILTEAKERLQAIETHNLIYVFKRFHFLLLERRLQNII